MNKYNGWVSLFREKRYLERYKEKYNQASPAVKEIVIMLDVRGTLDNITDELAKLFFRQLNYLRVKYNAQKAVIIVSSYNEQIDFKEYLDILKRNLIPHIELGDVVYLNGTYDINNDSYNFIKNHYNENKFDLFKKKYISRNTKWVGILDNDITFDRVKELKDIVPMALLRPSQCSEKDFKDDSLMCYSTLTFGFDGVVETLNRYIDRIKKAKKILKQQQNYLVHLSTWELKKLALSKNFDLLLRYLKEMELDDTDYEVVVREMEWQKQEDLSESELRKINKIIEIALSHIQKNEEMKLNLTNRKS